ncbi:hypothetical protein CR513_45024, partial [Mucuna pruriens]
MAFPLSSHRSLDRNLINRGRLGRRYNFKFVTCGLESLSSHILKNAMNKIRNGHDNVTWIPAKELQRLPSAREVKYQQHREKLQQCVTKEGTFANDSSSTSINGDDVYCDIVGGKNDKGNIYGLGRLSNKFIRSTHIQPNLIEMSMVEQLKEMRETIYKLNNEFIAKE